MASRAGRVVVAGIVAMAVVASGCGDGGDEVATRTADGAAHLPGGMVVAALAAEEHAWVLTSTGGAGPVTISRVAPAGDTTEVGTVRGGSVRAATDGAELFVLSSVCDDGEEECDRDRALLWVVGEDGIEVDGVEVDRADDESGALGGTIVGIADPDLWITTSGGATRVSPAGEVVERAPLGGGLHCVVDGRLFATSRPDRGGSDSIGGGPIGASDDLAPADPGGATSEDVTPTELTVAELVDGTWVDVDGASIPLAPLSDLACTPPGIERFGAASAVPDALWTPDGGLVPVAADAEVSAGLQGPALPTPHGEQYVVDGEGRLLVRAAGSASFEHRPGAGREELRARSVPTYDASSTLEVWCGTPAGDEPARPTCWVSRR